MKKPAPLTRTVREKLIIALDMHDIVASINLAMRVRKVSLTVDYSEDHFGRLYIEMPGIPRQQIMLLDQRKHCCYINPPSNRELFFAYMDISGRLAKLGGRLSLSGDRPRQGPRRCVLQVYVDGASKIGLTLMEAVRGQSNKNTEFQLPDRTVP